MREGLLNQIIYLGAGCFWCVEAIFVRIKGVMKVTSGYMGGHLPNPTYEKVCEGNTGHVEVVKLDFDPEKIPLEKILNSFWKAHDPTTLNRQGPDVGEQYSSVIFCSQEVQKNIAQNSKKEAQKAFVEPIVTKIELAGPFYPAEEYHQNFFEKNPTQGYCLAQIPPKLKKLNLV